MNEISKFHLVTPFIESKVLSDLSKAGETKIFLKLENIQPSGSFKIRGIGHNILTEV